MPHLEMKSMLSWREERAGELLRVKTKRTTGLHLQPRGFRDGPAHRRLLRPFFVPGTTFFQLFLGQENRAHSMRPGQQGLTLSALLGLGLSLING